MNVYFLGTFLTFFGGEFFGIFLGGNFFWEGNLFFENFFNFFWGEF